MYQIFKKIDWITVFFYSSISKKCIFPAVASLCYQTSVTAKRVVLDGFLTYQSSTTTCSCTLTSSKSTTVSFVALNNLQPNHAGCGSNILVQAGGTSFIINCLVSGTAPISPSQSITLNFEKPPYVYDSNYCMLLNTGKQINWKRTKIMNDIFS